ncbi:hypothetical protein C1H46_044177 [Malus baccata]|uniref:Uncharacterized protein n=1 Tax=Malus baccata TaxID=106549 RepID=A0A540K7S6_MALBA|nr:hypothetical protein C1H46_044177 [Malus baccata]
MALVSKRSKLLCANVFLLALILSYGIIAAEARLLNTTETNSAVQEPMPPPMLAPEVEPIPVPPGISDADYEEPPPDVTVF